jgi:hypothetical protein
MRVIRRRFQKLGIGCVQFSQQPTNGFWRLSKCILWFDDLLRTNACKRENVFRTPRAVTSLVCRQAAKRTLCLVGRNRSFRGWSGVTRWVAAPGRSTIKALRRLWGCGNSRRSGVWDGRGTIYKRTCRRQVNRYNGSSKDTHYDPSSGGLYCLQSNGRQVPRWRALKDDLDVTA